MFTLELRPYSQAISKVNLSEEKCSWLDLGSIKDVLNKDVFIFSNLTYSFHLDGFDLNRISDVSLFINDIEYDCDLAGNEIRLFHDKRPFLDCYGYVELSLHIDFNDGSELDLFSNMLPVLVDQTNNTESVDAMVMYLYQHQQALLNNGEERSRITTDLRKSSLKSLDSQIALLKTVSELYENNLGYFRINCRMKFDRQDTVLPIEQVQHVTPKTIQYALQHPEELKEVNGKQGIRINRRVYHPKRTLAATNVYSKDIYENRIVLGFLQLVISEGHNLVRRVGDLIEEVSWETNIGNYYYSPTSLLSGPKRLLKERLKRLDDIVTRLRVLFFSYASVLDIKPAEKSEFPPKSTAIFRSVPQYRQFFEMIYKWNYYGIYDLSNEVFILSFLNISSIYENYILVRIIEALKEMGYLLSNSNRYSYKLPSKSWYSNTRSNNTFVFELEEKKITLYYQPVIFGSSRAGTNGIELFRNNSVSMKSKVSDNRKGRYYVPDFLLKVEKSNASKFIVFDAKFSDLKNVRIRYAPELSFKYLLSLTPLNDNSELAGLCIIYGKPDDSDIFNSYYDLNFQNKNIIPFIQTFPLKETLNGDSCKEILGSILSLVD